MVYHVINDSLKNYWLLFVSLLFFAWSQPQYWWIILISVAINYVSAMLIYVRKSKVILVVAVILNLLLLFYFKYFNFFIDTIDLVFSTNIVIDQIILPVGISFFTFQGMSYVIDVYRGTVGVQKNPVKVALYIMLFPQLVAGPIVRYADIESEISSRKVTVSDFEEGVTRFIIGLGKKAIIANSMAEIVDPIWKAGVDNNTIAIAWAGSIAYSLQIFYDFSGYSDMAIGIGRMLGFHFNENFNFPYISTSITEFWRRWHISLSTWFRDYVYIPLGGNRKNLYRNLIIVFLLTGLWHGASWTFILWGAWNAAFIVGERLLRSRTDQKKGSSVIFYKSVASHIYALFVINIGWVLFRADNVGTALRYIGTMFGVGLGKMPGFTLGWYINNWNIFITIVAILLATSLPTKVRDIIKAHMPENLYLICRNVLTYCVLLLGAMRIFSSTYNPFIYFQF